MDTGFSIWLFCVHLQTSMDVYSKSDICFIMALHIVAFIIVITEMVSGHEAKRFSN